MDTVKEINHNGKIIKIMYDESPESPSEWDNLGTIAYKSGSKYVLGYEEFPLEEMEEIANSKEYIWLPVYAYIHSGIALNTGGFSCPWGSGQSGLVFVSKQKIRQEYNKKRISKKLTESVKNILKSQVETFSQYLNGEVYGFMIEDKEGNCIDSCFGYYGLDFCEEQAKEAC